MLPPVLEIYVVWHPDDRAGGTVAEEIMSHFRGTAFTGLIGGAAEVYARSEGWADRQDAPRPIPLPGAGPPNGLIEAQLIAVVPVLGPVLAAAVSSGGGVWSDYAKGILSAADEHPDRVGVFPVLLDSAVIAGTELGRLFGGFQAIGRPPSYSSDEPAADARCRDLAQGIAQLAGEPRVTAFISYTGHVLAGEKAEIIQLVDQVQRTLSHTRLDTFIDVNTLQPGTLWREELTRAAGRNALLALRTDLYARRHYPQEEVRTAKCQGMPVVVADALLRGEERGPFLMDHVPRVPVRRADGRWRQADIQHSVNLLVDECLKRALWRRQRELAERHGRFSVDWWAPHAPEPLTFAAWLHGERSAGRHLAGASLSILHPDPPLLAHEAEVLHQMAVLAGVEDGLEIMTPRQFAARGG